MTRKRIICIYVLVLKPRNIQTHKGVAIMTEKINLIVKECQRERGDDHQQNEEEGKWSILFRGL
jgi:hypothetical protein